MLIKQLTAFFLSFVLIFISTPSFSADPNDFRKPNQWQRERTINDAINKSSVKVEAQKTYPVSTLDQNGKPIKQIRNAKATITLGAKSSNVAKSLMKRAPNTAIGYAVVAILGRAVDWVLDPENNRVKYKDQGGDFPTGNWVVGTSKAKTPEAAYTAHIAKNFPKEPNNATCTILDETTARCTVGWGTDNVKFVKDPEGEPQDWRYISGDELANKVIQQAQDDSKPDIQAPAMQVMNDAAIDALEAGLLDAQLDAASNVPQPDPQEITQAQYDNPNYPVDGTGTGSGNETETPTDPENPTDPQNPFELPPFCSWASKVCDFIDWYQKDPPDDTEIELPEPDMPDVDSDIAFGGSCPDDAGFTMNIFGNDVEFIMMPFSKFCPLLETYIKPVLVVLGSFMAVTIVGGRRDG